MIGRCKSWKRLHSDSLGYMSVAKPIPIVDRFHGFAPTSCFVSYTSQLRKTKASPNIVANSENEEHADSRRLSSTNDWARGEELPPSVALRAATACVEYRSAGTPAFAA